MYDNIQYKIFIKIVLWVIKMLYDDCFYSVGWGGLWNLGRPRRKFGDWTFEFKIFSALSLRIKI